jgi:hypothetical protein
MKQYQFSPNRLQNFLTFFLVAILSVCMVRATAQTNNKPVFVSFTYMKTAPGKYNDYLNLARTISKPLQEYQVQQGKQLGWYLYEVLMPTGSEAEYNIIGVNVNTDMQQLLDPVITMREVFKKAFPQMTAQQEDSVIQQFNLLRSVVKREIYLHRSGTNEDGPPAKYAEVDFMAPVQGKGADYAKMEEDKFLPVHKQRMALGALKGWRLAEKIMPASTDDPYPYITVNFYDNIDMMMDGKYPEAVKKAWPMQDATKLFQQVNTVKKGQKNELWKLVDYTDQGNKK